MRALLSILIILAVTPPSFAQTARTYEYDALGRLTKVTTTDGRTVTYSYDAADNRTSVVAVGGSPPPTTYKVVVVPLGGYFIIPIPN